jgi:hypothetical protein
LHPIEVTHSIWRLCEYQRKRLIKKRQEYRSKIIEVAKWSPFEQGSLAYQLNRLAFGFLPVKNLSFLLRCSLAKLSKTTKR